MNTKLMTGLGCLLLVAGALAPNVLGHQAGGTAGVYGTYYGAAGPAVLPNGHSAPEETLSAGQMLCDMEVLGSGGAPDPDFDEVDVDHSAGGNMADGTFDDGGQGGACHTNHYGWAPYNTDGCLQSTAFATDVDAAVDPWIGASCDFETVTGGTPQSQIFTTCVVNEILTQDVLGIVDCATAFLACTTSPVGCASGGVRTCGADAIADGINYGHGSAGVAFPYSSGSAHQGTAFEDATDDEAVIDIDCSSADATSAVFVFSAVSPDGPHLAGSGVISS